MENKKNSNDHVDFEIIVNLSHDEFVRLILNKSQNQSETERKIFLNNLLSYFKEKYDSLSILDKYILKQLSVHD